MSVGFMPSFTKVPFDLNTSRILKLKLMNRFYLKFFHIWKKILSVDGLLLCSLHMICIKFSLVGNDLNNGVLFSGYPVAIDRLLESPLLHNLDLHASKVKKVFSCTLSTFLYLECLFTV